MSSTVKTLELLKLFTPMMPEIGLSQLCRLAHRDKATTYRYLRALEKSGFVEQNSVTKEYRLGPALLQLGQMREITVPRKVAVESPLQELAEATGETSHVSVLSGNLLYKLASVEAPQQSIRVIIDIEIFPLHATASGLCALAFGPESLFKAALTDMAAFTPKTIKSANDLAAAKNRVAITGFGIAEGTLETDVYSIAAPVFDQTGLLAGCVSTASVASRFNPEQERNIKEQLVKASRKISRNWGGQVPAEIERAWTSSLSHSHPLEAIS